MHIVKPKCVLFDWDNTIVDTWPKIAIALNAALSHFDKPTMTLEDVKSHSHKSLKDAFPTLFGHHWEEARDVYYRSYYTDEEIGVLPGAADVLQLLSTMSVKMGVVSNKRGDMLRNEVIKAGFADYFFDILGSLDTPCDKPHPDPVYHILRKVDIESSNKVWFIGDTTVDIECAVNSGCMPILYGDKTSSPDLDEKHFKYIHVETHQDFLKLIAEHS